MQQPGINWNPQIESELRSAAEDGLLEETHFLDLKRELAKGDGANKSFAKDIAAFALDGGTIVIGVDEAVALTTTLIPASSDADHGYVVVHVPRSPRAPHMVHGRYYRRGDKTNRQLPNAEVTRRS